MDYSNLRIRAYLRTPVISDEWLPLDGILFYQQTRQALGHQDATIPGASQLEQPKGGPMLGGRLPIAIIHAKDWYYRCSWAQWGPHADGQDYWSKRFDNAHADLVDFHGRRGRVDTSAGEYKAYRMPVYYRSALWVEWYLVGNLPKITPILHMVTHLGKKTAQGWGRVASWEIEPCEKDCSIWREGKLMRGVPFYHLPNGVSAKRPGNYGIRPSYWDRRNQIELELP